MWSVAHSPWLFPSPFIKSSHNLIFGIFLTGNKLGDTDIRASMRDYSAWPDQGVPYHTEERAPCALVLLHSFKIF